MRLFPMQSSPRAVRSVLAPAAMALALGLVTLSAPAQAQRDPAYAAARAAGQVGEKMDGYLGFVNPPPPSLKALVEDLNIKRKAVYAEQAQVQHATLEEYAFTAGCLAFARTVPGEMYQAPDGAWHTRSAGTPDRDARCP